MAVTPGRASARGGPTTILPVPVHRSAPDGASLSATQLEENRASVHRAWRLHYDDVRHSLSNALYQGWDLHPAQLPTRYAALYAFFLEGLDTFNAPVTTWAWLTQVLSPVKSCVAASNVASLSMRTPV